MGTLLRGAAGSVLSRGAAGSLLTIRFKGSQRPMQVLFRRKLPATKTRSLVYNMVALACDRGERQKACAFRAPLLEPLLSTGKKTTLFCGQTMDLTAATAYSFVLIQRGAFMLCKNGKIIQVAEQGHLLGLPEFVLNLPFCDYELRTHGDSSEFVVVQVCLVCSVWFVAACCSVMQCIVACCSAPLDLSRCPPSRLVFSRARSRRSHGLSFTYLPSWDTVCMAQLQVHESGCSR